jgi:hypothetical protein
MKHSARSTLFVILLAASPTTFGQICECIDQADIKHRLAEARAAVNAYAKEMGRMVEYSEAERRQMQQRVQAAVNGAQVSGISPTPRGDPGNPGGTNSVCLTDINLSPSATACMRTDLQKHEDYHQQQCLARWKKLRPYHFLIEYAIEETTAYMQEITFLQSELARLEKSDACKPKPPQERRDYTSLPREPSGRP